MFQFNAYACVSMVAIVLCWGLAIVLRRVGVKGGVARKLALLLAVEGVMLLSSGYLDLFLTDEAKAQPWWDTWFAAEFVVHTAADCAMLALYPAFLATALQTNLTRPFASRQAQIVIGGLAFALFLLVQFTPYRYGTSVLYVLLSALFTFALIASVHAWVTAPPAKRAQARSFAIAFGARDLLWGYVYGVSVWQNLQLTATMGVPDNVDDPIFLLYTLGSLLAAPLIAYGILREQLFDIDLRVRWTIKQSTVAAVMVAVIYLVSEAADRFLSAELGAWPGLVAAAIVVFFMAPLQSFAERVAKAAMPAVNNTPEYTAFRKLQVYEAALSDALSGGGVVSARERALLDRLRDSLGITPADADALERDALNSARS